MSSAPGEGSTFTLDLPLDYRPSGEAPSLAAGVDIGGEEQGGEEERDAEPEVELQLRISKASAARISFFSW